MSSKLKKKDLQIISGTKLGVILNEKVGNLEDFASSVGYTRQWINKLIKKEKARIDEKRLDKIKEYLNVTAEDLRYVSRETEGKSNGNSSNMIERHPLYISLKRELEEVRQSREDWKERAREYKQELDRLRGQ